MNKRYIRCISLCLLASMLLCFAVSAVAESNGTIVLGSGATYTGNLVLENIPNGTGEAVWPDGGKYTGEFFNGMPNGKGTFAYTNGDTYVGRFEYGFRSGEGKMTFANGDTYDGEWKADIMHGEGKYTFKAPDPKYPKKNDVYTGQWRYNMIHGKGVYQFANGTTTKGYWMENTYVGQKLTVTQKKEIGALD